MHNLVRDIRYAFRQLRRAPGVALTAVLTLALGIGASSAIFCLIDNLWLHPLRVPHPGELVRVFATTKQAPTAKEGVDTYFTYSEYQAIATRITALKTVVALGRRGSLMQRRDGTAVLLLTNVVSSNFFEASAFIRCWDVSIPLLTQRNCAHILASCLATTSGNGSLRVTRVSLAVRYRSCVVHIIELRSTSGECCRRRFVRSITAWIAISGCRSKPGQW